MAKYLIEPVIGGGQVTSTSIPLATAVAPGTQYFDTAIGTGTLFTSDGISWNQLNPIRLLAQSAIPVILPSSGTLSAAGALSGIVALAGTYPSCWMALPANATATVSVAGVYFVQMSSTTAGTVFQNQLISGSPSTIPTAAQLIPCTTASSFTQTVGSDVSVITIPIPANSMGANGKVRIDALFGNATSANAKIGKCSFGGQLIAGSSNTTNLQQPVSHEIVNRNLTNSQVVGGGTGYVVSAAAPLSLAVDTTAAVNFILTLQNTVAAADSCQWENFTLLLTAQS